jgi:hypothetical protein
VIRRAWGISWYVASAKAALIEVQRAQILWRYHASETITEIARALRTTRKSVGKR